MELAKLKLFVPKGTFHSPRCIVEKLKLDYEIALKENLVLGNELGSSRNKLPDPVSWIEK